MATKLIIDGNAVYEIDEDCLECQKRKNNSRQWAKPEDMDPEYRRPGVQNRDPRNQESP